MIFGVKHIKESFAFFGAVFTTRAAAWSSGTKVNGGGGGGGGGGVK